MVVSPSGTWELLLIFLYRLFAPPAILWRPAGAQKKYPYPLVHALAGVASSCRPEGLKITADFACAARRGGHTLCVVQGDRMFCHSERSEESEPLRNRYGLRPFASLRVTECEKNITVSGFKRG